MPRRFSPHQRLLATAASDFLQRRGQCLEPDNPLIPGVAVCRLGDPARTPDFLVWGDSHGRAFRDGLDLAATEHGRAGLLVWAGGCPPLVDLHKQESANTPDEDRRCFTQSARLLAWLRTDRTLRDVLLIGRWAYYAEGRGIGADGANRLILSVPGQVAPQAQLLAAALIRTVALLREQGRRVFVLEQVPEVPMFSARALAERVLARREPLPMVVAAIGTVDRRDVDTRQRVAAGALQQLSRTGEAGVIATHPLFCTGRRCSAWIAGRPLLFDNNHVTVDASLRLRGIFAPLFAANREGRERGGAEAPPHPTNGIRTRS